VKQRGEFRRWWNDTVGYIGFNRNDEETGFEMAVVTRWDEAGWCRIAAYRVRASATDELKPFWWSHLYAGGRCLKLRSRGTEIDGPKWELVRERP
jgi:hypothetical protein